MEWKKDARGDGRLKARVPSKSGRVVKNIKKNDQQYSGSGIARSALEYKENVNDIQ